MLSIIFIAGCRTDKTPLSTFYFDEASLISIEQDYQPKAKLCTWKGNKKAAYTIAFDDARPSHYQVSGPELKAREMVGTFNLHTKNLLDWRPWQKLYDDGNEIASHTWSHLMCSQLSEADLRIELTRAKSDILAGIKGITEVSSFTYPFGDSNELVRKVVMEYHKSARGAYGINGSVISDDEWSLIKGTGAYPPYDMDALDQQVEKTIKDEGWILVYFHSVSANGEMDETTIPLQRFAQHLDFVSGKKDSLWIATQGQVVEYIKVRERAKLDCSIIEGNRIKVSLYGGIDIYSQKSKLSYTINLPNRWLSHKLIVQGNKNKDVEVLNPKEEIMLLNMLPETTVNIFAIE